MLRTISPSARDRGMRFAMTRVPRRPCQVCLEVNDISPFKPVVRAPGGGVVCLRCAVRLHLVLVEP